MIYFYTKDQVSNIWNYYNSSYPVKKKTFITRYCIIDILRRTGYNV